MHRLITLNVDVELLDAVVCGHRPAEGPWCDVLVTLPLGALRPRHVPVTAHVRAWREFCCVAGCVPRLRAAALRLHGRMIRAMAAWTPRTVH